MTTITIEALMAQALFAFVTSITPGPNNMMLVASGMNYGFVRSLPHMLGINLGFPIMLVAVGLGFGTLFQAYPQLHGVLQIVGAAYLLYLAWQIARAGAPDITGRARGKPLTLLQAAAFQWVNPKAWVTATGAVALFLGRESFVPGLLTLAFLYALINFPCIALWAAFGQMMGRVLKSETSRRVFNITMAVLLVLSVFTLLLDGSSRPSIGIGQ